MRKTCQYWNRSPISKVNVTIGQFNLNLILINRSLRFQLLNPLVPVHLLHQIFKKSQNQIRAMHQMTKQKHIYINITTKNSPEILWSYWERRQRLRRKVATLRSTIGARTSLHRHWRGSNLDLLLLRIWSRRRRNRKIQPGWLESDTTADERE